MLTISLKEGFFRVLLTIKPLLYHLAFFLQQRLFGLPDKEG